MSNTAIIRIRGPASVSPHIAHTLKLLNLHKPNNATLREDTKQLKGMLTCARSYITWGDANEETILLFGNKKNINLQPPRGGYERKGIKTAFKKGGAFGSRKEKINDLIKRMH
jgi:large subunit ribosomal protein L30